MAAALSYIAGTLIITVAVVGGGALGGFAAFVMSQRTERKG